VESVALSFPISGSRAFHCSIVIYFKCSAVTALEIFRFHLHIRQNA
jgi:hypothetical protein